MKQAIKRLLSCGHEAITSKRNMYCDKCGRRRRVVAGVDPCDAIENLDVDADTVNDKENN